MEIKKRNMKISIITPTLNSAETIRDCIESVKNQTYTNIEHIIVDGGSTDATLEIVKGYVHTYNLKFISEKDNGVYDAMNKGIKMSTGDVIGILNSDDMYSDNTVLEIVAIAFLTNHIDCLYGDLVYVDKHDTSKVVRYWKSREYQEGLFHKGWHPPHPTFFCKRICYEKYGTYNIDFKFAADYELMLRFLEKHKLRSLYINKVLVKMRVGGISNRSIFNIIKANIECYKAWKVNGLHINPIMLILKPLSKIFQYIKSCES
jgi:glycosyltransferase